MCTRLVVVISGQRVERVWQSMVERSWQSRSERRERCQCPGLRAPEPRVAPVPVWA